MAILHKWLELSFSLPLSIILCHYRRFGFSPCYASDILYQQVTNEKKIVLDRSIKTILLTNQPFLLLLLSICLPVVNQEWHRFLEKKKKSCVRKLQKQMIKCLCRCYICIQISYFLWYEECIWHYEIIWTCLQKKDIRKKKVQIYIYICICY